MDDLVSSCDRGLYRDTLQQLESELAGRHPGEHPETAELACRLGANLGLPALGRMALRRLGVACPEHPRTKILIASERIARRRMLPALRFVMQEPVPAGADADTIGRYHSTRALFYQSVRDYRRAEAEIESGLAVWADHPWLHADLVTLRTQQDRLDEALRLGRELRERHPHYARVRHQIAGILHELADPTALEEYRVCYEEIQSPRVASEYASSLLSNRRPAAARGVLEGILERFRLSAGARRRYYRGLAFVCREMGDDEAARDHAARAGEPGRQLLANYRSAAAAGTLEQPRVRLDVPFVRQDYETCAPATVAALLAFHGEHFDQREIAREITYGGTPKHEVMRWLEDRGISVRFFAFDPGVARALIDQGFPFAISTLHATSGHQQGVIGYDPVLGTFLLHEPGTHAPWEVFERDLVAQQMARGGGCSLPLPGGKVVDLPNEGLPFEAAHRSSVLFERAIAEHRIDTGCELLESLQQLEPCPIRWQAERAMLWENRDRRGIADSWRAQHEAHPEDPVVKLRMAEALADAGLWDEHYQFLDRVAHEPGADLHLQVAFASLLSERDSTLDRARRLLEGALLRSYRDQVVVTALAVAYGRRPEDRDLSVELFRIASCLEPHDENCARAYFDACHRENRAEEGLAYLRARATDLGARSSDSVGTLASALSDLYRPAEGIAVLRESLARHDSRWGRHLLFSWLLRVGDLDGAERELELLRQQASAGAYWTSRYRLERARGDRAAALESIEKAIAENPEDVESQSWRLELIHESQGASASRQAAAALAAAHPNHAPMQQAAVNGLLAAGGHEESIPLLRRLIERHPRELWIRSELGRQLLMVGRVDEARDMLENFVQEEARSARSWFDLGRARALAGDSLAAHAALRRALELDVAQPQAIFELLQQAGSRDAAVADLQFVGELIRRQVPDAGVLGEFLDHARTLLSAAAVRDLLEHLEREHPGHPETGVAHGDYLLRQGEPGAAESIARALVESHGWVGAAHLLLARALFDQDRVEEGRDVLRRLIDRDPNCEEAYLRLGRSFEDAGDLAAAAEVFECGILRCGAAAVHGHYAGLAWRRGQVDDALEHIAVAMEKHPYLEWAHDTRIEWLLAMGRKSEAVAVAEAHVDRFPNWPCGRQVLAEALRSVGRHDQVVAELHAALRLDPRLGDARRLLVQGLVSLARYDEAERVAELGFELLGDDPDLRLEALDVQRQRGDVDGARAALREYLDDHEDFRAGWVRWLGWCEEDDALDEVLAMEARPPVGLAGLAPFYGYVADHHAGSGRIVQAKRALRRAIELAPRYNWAVALLGRLLRDEQNYEEEAEVYAGCADPHAVGSQLAAQVAANAARLGDAERAVAFCVRALTSMEAGNEALADAFDAIESAGGELGRRLQQAIEDARAADEHGFVERHLASVHARRGRRRAFWQVVESVWARGDEAAERQLAEILGEAGETGLAGEIAKWLVAHVRAPIRSDELWGMYGWAVKDSEAIVATMADDFRRPGAEAWMLANLANAMMKCGRCDRIGEVSEFGLSLPRDGSEWSLRKSLAYDAYLRGDDEGCVERATMSTPAFPGERVGCRVLQVLVEVRRESGWFARRRRLRRFLPELFQLCDAAGASDYPLDRWDFYVPEMRALVLCEISLLMGFDFGRRLLRATS